MKIKSSICYGVTKISTKLHQKRSRLIIIAKKKIIVWNAHFYASYSNTFSLPFYYKYFFQVFPQVLEKRVVARKQKKKRCNYIIRALWGKLLRCHFFFTLARRNVVFTRHVSQWTSLLLVKTQKWLSLVLSTDLIALKSSSRSFRFAEPAFFHTQPRITILDPARRSTSTSGVPERGKQRCPLLHLVRPLPESVYPVATWEADWKCKANCERKSKSLCAFVAP